MTGWITPKIAAERMATIPNVVKVEYGTNGLTIWFDNIHSREYTWNAVERICGASVILNPDYYVKY